MVRDSKTDVLHTYGVQSADGAVVTLVQAAEIDADDLYTFGEATKEAKPFRVLSITKGMTEQTRKITCMEYYPELYADDNSDVPIIDYTTQSDMLAVNNLLVVVDIKTLPDGTTLYDLAASWRLPRSAVAKQIKVEYKREAEAEYTTQGIYDGNATSTVIAGVAAAVSYTVRVTCYNDLGLAGRPAAQTVYTAPKDAPPSTVQDFSVVQDAGNSSVLQLSWKANPETDILGYRLFDGAGSVLVDLIGGTSYSYFIPTSGTYVFGLRAVNRSGVVSAETADVSITATVAAGSVAVPDAPHSGEVRLQGGTVTAVWEAVTNTYIDYYEVRTNSNTGQLAGLLAKTADIRSAVSLTARSGAVLVYGHNPQKGYGEPLSIHYDFPAPAAPTIKITNTLQGFSVSIQNKPENVSGTRVHITGGGINETLETTGTFVSYVGAAGVYTVQAACFDSFGDGELSAAQEVIVKAKIDKNDIENLSIAEKDLDAALAERMRDVQTTKESVSSIVAKLSGNPQESGYSAITQIYNGLQLKVNQGDVVAAINVAPGGVKIDGRLLHITGNTIIDGNVIANHMLQAGAITADKLAVDSLSAVSAKIGKLRTKDTGARTEISDNLIEVFDEGEKTRVRIGIFE